MRIPPRSFLGVTLALTWVGACIAIPEGEGIPPRITDQDDASADAFLNVDAGTPPPQDARTEMPPADPHAIIGIDPSHGPFSGGRLAVLRGNGFKSTARVWFGNVEVPAQDVTAADPTRIQVVVPPADPGQVDVRTQNGDDESTSRTLQGGFTYDAFYADPSTGPTSGGTIVKLRGKLTGWTSAVEVRIANSPCLTTTVVSATEIECVTPPQPAGSAAISITLPDDTPRVVYDAFTYTDSDNGFKGGLSGAALQGVLKVAAYNAYTGAPIPAVQVIAGDNVDTALLGKTNSAGILVLQDAQLQQKRSVTLAKTCFQPTTFIDVTVDTVTAYLSPVMTPACLGDGGEIPPVGGKGSSPASIQGELVWQGGTEFKRAHWSNVPYPKTDDERQAAYLFQPMSDPTARFSLPDASRAVLSDADGGIGYEFSMTSSPGNITLYALAGIENRGVTPATFTAYAMGLAQGISTKPGETTPDVFIHMNKPLDQAVVLSVEPPVAGPKGPDRLISSVAVKLGNEGYAIFPNAQRTTLLADTGDIPFVGLPGLTDSLAGSRFVSSAKAATGANAGTPVSTVGKFLTTDATVPVHIDGFVQVPVLEAPAAAEPFDGRHLQVSYAPGGARIDVTVVRIQAGSGLVEWLVVVPGSKSTVVLPDLAALGLGLPSGSLAVHVYAGHVGDGSFSYETLVYRQLDARGWTAHAYDVFNRFLGGS